MSDTTKSIRRPTVIRDLPKSVPPLIVYAEGIVKCMTGSNSFPNPSPALTAISSAIDDLQTAETAALARTKGAATERNAKRAALVALLQQLRAYIQTTADANPPNAASIIQSAGVADGRRWSVWTVRFRDRAVHQMIYGPAYGIEVPQKRTPPRTLLHRP